MKPLAFLLLPAGLALAVPVLSQSHDHAGHVAQAPKSAAAAAMADGEVRKIDKDAAKITLKHGPIKNLDMTPMTMVFQVKDKSLLDKVKVGDKVRFSAEQNAGAYVVTAIETAK